MFISPAIGCHTSTARDALSLRIRAVASGFGRAFATAMQLELICTTPGTARNLGKPGTRESHEPGKANNTQDSYEPRTARNPGQPTAPGSQESKRQGGQEPDSGEPVAARANSDRQDSRYSYNSYNSILIAINSYSSS